MASSASFTTCSYLALAIFLQNWKLILVIKSKIFLQIRNDIKCEFLWQKGFINLAVASFKLNYQASFN